MLLTASYKPERPFVVVVPVSRWHVFLSDVYFPEHPKQYVWPKRESDGFYFSGQCADSLRPNGARYGGTDGIEFRRHWLCVLYLRNTTDATLGSTGFSLSARERETSGTQASDSVFGGAKCTHIPRKNTTPAKRWPQLCMFGGIYDRGNTNPVPAEVGRLFAIQTSDVYPPWFFFLLQIDGADGAVEARWGLPRLHFPQRVYTEGNLVPRVTRRTAL